MIQKLLHQLLLRRHFWRYATFSEVAELYASRTIRMFALRMVAVFVSIYLLQQGFDLVFLALFWAAFFFYKSLFAWPAALFVGWMGPKHGTLVSNILSAASMVFLPFVSQGAGLWALAAWCVLQASSTCLYDLCYLVDFSKVKNVEHAGKEIAFMNILEKIASGVSPVIGGFLAFIAGPQAVMVVSAILFLLAALPLFKTGEPVPTRQKISFEGFPWRTTWRSLVAETAIGVDTFATGTAWTLFIAVTIFTVGGDDIYAKIGLLSSISLFAALATSYAFGLLIDRRRGGELLRVGALANSAVHILRAFVTTPLGVATTNIMNEMAVTGYAMPFVRGLFDTADSSGKRIGYLFLIAVVGNFGHVIAAVGLAIILSLLPDEAALRSYFVIIGAITLLIMMPRFMLYRK